MPDRQTRLQAHKNDFVRVKANNHDKGRIATNKAEPRIRGASIVDSLPCSSLFVLLLQPKLRFRGRRPTEVGCEKQPSFYENAVVEHKAQRHFEGVLSLRTWRPIIYSAAPTYLFEGIVPHVAIEMYIAV
jgi:hypothetical protein